MIDRDYGSHSFWCVAMSVDNVLVVLIYVAVATLTLTLIFFILFFG